MAKARTGEKKNAPYLNAYYAVQFSIAGIVEAAEQSEVKSRLLRVKPASVSRVPSILLQKNPHFYRMYL